jgi:hypothetical protein
MRVENGICLTLDSREILRTAGRWKVAISQAA